MREGVDSIRVRAEGSVEVLERAAARLALVARALDTGEARALLAVTEDELRAYDEVVQLDAGHDSLKRFDAARVVFAEARARWVKRYKVEPAQHLPVLLEDTLGVQGTPWWVAVAMLVGAVGSCTAIANQLFEVADMGHIKIPTIGHFFFIAALLLNSSVVAQYRRVRLTVTSKALLVDGKEIPFETIERLEPGKDDTFTVVHRDGQLKLRAARKSGSVMALINEALPRK